MGNALVKVRECAYTIFEADGTAKCGIEKAYFDGKISFRKPISCHLYPIRLNKHRSGLEAANYDRWSVCRPACKLGDSLKVPIYKFLKDALIRKYGKAWYKKLELAAKEYEAAKGFNCSGLEGRDETVTEGEGEGRGARNEDGQQLSTFNFQPTRIPEHPTSHRLFQLSTFNFQLTPEPETRNSKPSTRLTDICNNLQAPFPASP